MVLPTLLSGVKDVEVQELVLSGCSCESACECSPCEMGDVGRAVTTVTISSLPGRFICDILLASNASTYLVSADEQK